MVARQAPLSMRFPRQEYWSGLLCPSSGDLPDPGIEPASPALTGRWILYHRATEAWPRFTPHLPTKPPRGACSAGSSGNSEARGASSFHNQGKKLPTSYLHLSGLNSLRGSQESLLRIKNTGAGGLGFHFMHLPEPSLAC